MSQNCVNASITSYYLHMKRLNLQLNGLILASIDLGQKINTELVLCLVDKSKN